MAIEYTVTKVEAPVKTSTGKDMYKTTLMAPDGTNETINLFDMVVEGAKLNGEIYTNDKGYRNFKSAQKAAGGAFRDNQKAAVIEKAMDKKNQNIAAAQDRSAWMWAKTNASTLLQGQLNGLDIFEIRDKVIELATYIYNGEPTEPFTSPKVYSEKDKINQEVGDKIFNSGLSDEDLEAMEHIPF